MGRGEGVIAVDLFAGIGDCSVTRLLQKLLAAEKEIKTREDNNNAV